MATEQLFTVQQAAHRKGVGYHTVLRAIHRGRLSGHRLGHQLFITPADLEDWQPKREHAPSEYRREPDLGAIASSLSLASLDRATLEDGVTALATTLIRTAGSLSLSQLQDVSQYLSGIVFDPQLAILRPSETTAAPLGGAETEMAIATNDTDARQHRTHPEPDGLAPAPFVRRDSLEHAPSVVGRWSKSVRLNHVGSESERAEKRATALSGLQSLQRELERLGSTQEPGSEALIWSGYRDVLHELSDLLRQAGEDVAPFDAQSGSATAKTGIARRGNQGILLDRLLADVKRVQEHVAGGAGQGDNTGEESEHSSCAGVAQSCR